MSARRRADIALTARIHEIHRRSRETYGSPMIHAELSDEHGIRVGRKRVARLMRAAGLCGATLRKFVVTTDSGTRRPEVADLVERRFYAERPNRLWVADATYIPTWSGFLYLAIVLDVFSRKVVGWAMQNTLHTELMLAAIDMAITIRRPQRVIHHSDHGCQYTSYAFGKRCQEAGIMPSMGTVGDAYCRVEMWRGDRRRNRNCCRTFRTAVPQLICHSSVSTSRSSNRTCSFTASGSHARVSGLRFRHGCSTVRKNVEAERLVEILV